MFNTEYHTDIFTTQSSKTVQLIKGNCLDIMKEMSDNSIDLIITSPPYFVKKEYEKKVTYEEYCELIQTVLLETNRLLKPGAYAVYNFGDYFNSGNRFYEADVPSCYPASINYFQWGVQDAGMDLQATRIWRKQFAKMGIPFVCNTHPRPIFDYEHVWTFRKKNGSKQEFVTDRKLTQRGVIGENWTSKADIKTHCAAFPVELPEWAISVYSQNEDDVIFDMFSGSGTTGLACIKQNRNFIGTEMSDIYYQDSLDRYNKNL
jgi:modification methylase